jgi:hypothetical protein
LGRRWCHAIDDLGLAWIEESIVYDNLDGYARLTTDLKTPVQTGENFYGPRALYPAFRGDRRTVEGDITYAQAEAGRILLAATGRRGITPDDKAYLARLVAARTGIALPDAERRVEDAITAASTAVKKARRSAVILGFASAASLLAGAAAAWYTACAGGRHRDNVAPPLHMALAPACLTRQFARKAG